MELENGKIYVVGFALVVFIDKENFAGNDYQHDILKGRLPDVQIEIFSNGGTGGLLKYGGGYSYNADTGTLTMNPDCYKIKIY